MLINSISDFRAAIRQGAYAWPGGYPTFFVMADGEALSFEAAKAERRLILEAIRDKAAGWPDNGWTPAALEINWEDGELYCAHTNARIESAYAEPENDDGPDLSRAELFANDSRGVYIPQFFAEAVHRAYVSGVTEAEWAVLEAGPDHNDYWDVWTSIEANAVINHPTLGECHLYQDGDLWIIPNA